MNEPNAGAGGDHTAPPGAAAARKKLRARMAAVMTAHEALQSASTLAALAEKTLKQALERWNARTDLHSDTDHELRQWLADAESRYLQWWHANRDNKTAGVAVGECRQQWWKECNALREELVQAGKLEDLRHDDVYLAASYMSSKLAPVHQQPAAAGELPVAASDPNDEQRTRLQHLREAMLVAAGQLVRDDAHKVLFRAAVDRVSETRFLCVEQPVRPIEEEIHRFLSQLEAAASARQKAHQQVHQLGPLSEPIAADATGAFAAMMQARTNVADLARNMSAAAALCIIVDKLDAARQVVVEKLKSDAERLRHYVSKLDSEVKPAATGWEKQRIDFLRQQMKSFAVALAKRNESREAFKQADRSPTSHVTRRGLVINAKIWPDCLAWHAARDSEHIAARNANKSREVKIQLLHEAFLQHRQEVSDQRLALYGFLVSIIPAPEIPQPCDELRMLINAAAWMYDLDHDPTMFPHY